MHLFEKSIIICLSLLFLSSGVNFKSIYDLYGVSVLIKEIEEIKQVQSPRKIQVQSYHLKSYSPYWNIWMEFNFENYLSSLNTKVQKLINKEEFEIEKKNLFLIKLLKLSLLKNRLIKLYNEILFGEHHLLQVSDKRKKVLNDLYSFLGFEILESNLKAKITLLSKTDVQHFRIKNILTQNEKYLAPVQLKDFNIGVRDNILYELDKSFQNIPTKDIKLFMKILNKNKLRGLTQLILNFHNLYLLNHVYELENKLSILIPIKSR